MGFADALAESRAKKGPTCSVHLILKQMGDEDADQFRAALGDEAIPHVTIEAAIRKMREADELTVDPGRGAVSRHRRHLCECSRADA